MGQEDLLKMQPVLYRLQAHPSEDDLEMYSLGRFGLADEERIETHLLTCHACCDKLNFLDDFRASLKAVVQRSGTL